MRESIGEKTNKYNNYRRDPNLLEFITALEFIPKKIVDQNDFKLIKSKLFVNEETGKGITRK